MKQKASRSKYTKRYETYEGEQYRGGRVKNKKNLRRENGLIINEHGVAFTEEEKKALERAVNRSNYQRKKRLNEWKKKSEENQQQYVWGEEPEFIISRQSKSLQRFRNKEEFEAYMVKQNDIRSGAYLDYRTQVYKDSYTKRIKKNLGEEANDIIEAVQKMDGAEFRKMVEDDKLPTIGYLYGPAQRAAKLSRLRAHFNVLSGEDYMGIT